MGLLQYVGPEWWLFVALIIMLLFLALRWVMCWYWKINARLTVAEKTLAETIALKKMVADAIKALGGIDKAQ